MRSHAFRPLASLIVSALALAACGETVKVGTFEDGTGGAGGGDPTETTGTATGSPTSSGGPTSSSGSPTGSTTGPSGSTGSDTTTTSVGPTGSGGDDTTTVTGPTTGTGGGDIVCGGLGGDGEQVCPEDMFCDWPEGGCGFDDGTGICKPRPQACPFDVVDPVCTCDGAVYQSECFANLEGQDVNLGAQDCNIKQHICGGKSGQTCFDNEFCDYDNGICGEADGTGVCRPRPTTCQSDGPVSCACDGQHYPSACEAALHGVDVVDPEFDLCPPAVQCGGLAGLECEPSEFCDYPNDLCGGDDGLGVCRPRPTDCPEPNADEAVCGCDFGSVYGSECLANMAGQDAAYGDALECGGA